MQRVRIGTCHNPADASLVRLMLSAHDIESVVSGEQHANLLGGLGGGLIQLDIWVAADDAEQASELLRELREGTHEEPADDEFDDYCRMGHRLSVQPQILPHQLLVIKIRIVLFICWKHLQNYMLYGPMH